MKIYQSLNEVDVGDLKLRINLFLRSENTITPSVQEYLDQLQSLTTPDGVLNFLINRKFLGYLNYELIKVFPKIVKTNTVQSAIDKYEEKYKQFLLPNSFNTLVEVFQYPKFAPDSPIGLPEFEIHLERPWEEKSIYDWKDFLDKEFLNSWPSHLIVKDIRKKCIILTYVVLPFFLPAVLEDLRNHQVLENLKKQGITVDLSKLETKVCN